MGLHLVQGGLERPAVSVESGELSRRGTAGIHDRRHEPVPLFRAMAAGFVEVALVPLIEITLARLSLSGLATISERNDPR